MISQLKNKKRMKNLLKFIRLFKSSKLVQTYWYIFIPQKVTFVGRLEEDSGVTVSFIVEKQQKIW